MSCIQQTQSETSIRALVHTCMRAPFLSCYYTFLGSFLSFSLMMLQTVSQDGCYVFLIPECHRDADALIEVMDGLYALLGSGSAEDVLAKRRDALHHLFVQFAGCGVEDMAHPAWSDDGKSFRVGALPVTMSQGSASVQSAPAIAFIPASSLKSENHFVLLLTPKVEHMRNLKLRIKNRRNIWWFQK